MEVRNPRLAFAVLAVLPPDMEPANRAVAVDLAGQIDDGYIDTFRAGGPKNYVKAALDLVASFKDAGGRPYNWVVDWVKDHPEWMRTTMVRDSILQRAEAYKKTFG